MHAACDALGNPLRFLLTPGQRSDFTQAGALISGTEPDAVIADKGYDADWLIREIDLLGAEVVISGKHYRRMATRYEKTARNYLAFIHVAATMTLLL